MTTHHGIATARAALAAGVARKQAHPTLRFCVPCNARERAIISGRCVICGQEPNAKQVER